MCAVGDITGFPHTGGISARWETTEGEVDECVGARDLDEAGQTADRGGGGADRMIFEDGDGGTCRMEVIRYGGAGFKRRALQCGA